MDRSKKTRQTWEGISAPKEVEKKKEEGCNQKDAARRNNISAQSKNTTNAEKREIKSCAGHRMGQEKRESEKEGTPPSTTRPDGDPPPRRKSLTTGSERGRVRVAREEKNKR